jgi:hypothetical protein
MTKAVGDTIFNNNGRPGVIVHREPTGHLLIDREGPSLKETQQRGYVNGLSAEQRGEFNKLIDQVRAIEKPEEKILEMQKIVESLRDEPTKHVIRKYVEAEMNHLMISHNIRPRLFVVDEQFVR